MELGPALTASGGVADDLAAIDKRLYVCSAADEAKLDRTAPVCSACGWRPGAEAPAADFKKLNDRVAAGLADRFRRFKDATIGAILKRAAESDGRADLAQLMKIIQLAKADALAGVMTEELAAFLRQLLYDENLVQEEVPLGAIVRQIGAIEGDQVDEAVDQFGRLLGKAVKSAKARHAPKRVRVFLRLGDEPEEGDG